LKHGCGQIFVENREIYIAAVARVTPSDFCKVILG